VRYPHRSYPECRLDLRLRLTQSDEIAQHTQIKLETTIRAFAREKRGERFWGRLALILKIRRVRDPVYRHPRPPTVHASKQARQPFPGLPRARLTRP